MNQSIAHSDANGAHPHIHAQNGHASNGTANHSGPVWDFLTATRERAAFNSIRDKHPDFDLRDVQGADSAAGLLWLLRCEHDQGAVLHDRPLDDVVADTLRLIADDDDGAREALAWLCDPNETFYKKPSDALKVAARLVKAWREPTSRGTSAIPTTPPKTDEWAKPYP